MHKLYDNYAFLNHYIHATINLSTKSEVNFIDYQTNNFVEKGTKAYAKIIIALFISGFTIFSILYSVQPLIPHFTKSFHVSETVASLALSVTTLTLALAMLFLVQYQRLLVVSR